MLMSSFGKRRAQDAPEMVLVLARLRTLEDPHQFHLRHYGDQAEPQRRA